MTVVCLLSCMITLVRSGAAAGVVRSTVVQPVLMMLGSSTIAYCVVREKDWRSMTTFMMTMTPRQHAIGGKGYAAAALVLFVLLACRLSTLFCLLLQLYSAQLLGLFQS